MLMLTPDSAYLLGFAIEAVLYGFLIAFSGAAVMLLTWRRRTDFINWTSLVLTFLMVGAASAHFGIVASSVVTALITHRNDPDGAYLTSGGVQYQMNILFTLCVLMSDLTLLYRCWLVWQKNTWILLLAATPMAAYTCTSIYGINITHKYGLFDPAVRATILALATTSFSIALAYNIIVTLLIAGRIWSFTRRFGGFFAVEQNATRYKSAIAILLESGAFTVMGQIINITIWNEQQRTQKDIAHMIFMPLAQIYCIVPTLIIVRVGMGITTQPDSAPSSTATFSAGRTRPLVGLTFASSHRCQLSGVSHIEDGDAMKSPGLHVNCGQQDIQLRSTS